MPKRTLPPPAPLPHLRFTVRKLTLSFAVDEHDAAGHVVAEGMAPHTVELMWPYSASGAELQAVAQQIEAQLNAPGGG